MRAFNIFRRTIEDVKTLDLQEARLFLHEAEFEFEHAYYNLALCRARVTRLCDELGIAPKANSKLESVK
jgi:hypothetical protein